MVTEMIGVGPMFHLKIVKLLLGIVEVVWRELRICCRKMMRRFDASDEHTKELRSDLESIGKKFDAHAISIKHLELQMAQLSSTMNPRKLGTLSRNTVKNLKNDEHCMTVTTRGGKQTIDQKMTSSVEYMIIGDDEVVEVNGALEDKTGKEAEVPQKVTPMPRPSPPFLQRLVKK